MKPVLFVSHSSRDSELATRIVDSITRRSDCLPIIDVHDLQQGTEWRRQLYQWMARCRAALVLLTEDAIESNWVLQEATILRARKALEPGFRVFLVMPPDVRARKPKRWRLFEPLQLDELQGFRTMDADAIADAVAGATTTMGGATTYFDRLSGLLEDILEAFKGKAETLSAISNRMRLDEAAWEAMFGDDKRLVTLIARRLCSGNLREFADLRDFVQTLKRVSPNSYTLSKVLHAIAPYWVDLGASASLAAIAAAPPPRLAAMRASALHDFTGQRYIDRHYQVYQKEPLILRLGGGNELAGEADLRTQLLAAARARNRAYQRRSDADLINVLRMPLESGTPEFVLLPEQRTEDAAFELANEFHRYVFIVPVADAAVVRSRWTRCEWIEPELSEKDEWDRFQEFGSAEELVG